jgi:hypothetical protein
MKLAVLLLHGFGIGVWIGCSSPQAPPASAASTTPPPTANAAPTPATVPSPPAGRAKAPAVIATAEASIAGVRAEVTELKRGSGGTLTLKFTIVNDSSRAFAHSDVGIGMGGLIDAPYTIGGVHLIDPVGKKKYFVAKDSAGACVCSSFGIVAGGQGANHWAKFSAPPDDVERLSVVIPSFAPMDDVPVSR